MVIAVTARDHAEIMDRILNSVFLERIPLPENIDGAPSEILPQIEADLKKLKRQQTSLFERRQEYQQKWRERLLAARRKAQTIQKRSKSQKARKANLEFLQAREQALQDVWDQAEEKLRNLTEQDEEYLETLKSLAFLGTRILQGESIVLYPESNGRNLLTDEQISNWSEEASDLLDRKVKFHLAKEDADIWGGIIAGMKGANRRVDASFKTRLQIARDEIQNVILKQLTKS